MAFPMGHLRTRRAHGAAASGCGAAGAASMAGYSAAGCATGCAIGWNAGSGSNTAPAFGA